ncbi:hypothetical protein GJV26_01725 [Massilia dura]|uniref:Uncharacterized protein n=1 Tax=Pseudoduganella dura TaxID=321982 RepID=A0A6I3X607_9BURK|nr:hypothetical protein [Pseudoduganella dura]MUI11216.1 hypothetical protein [Pseudoduganella dura]GGX93987.1 hypothetical protein GCM10007386_26120 [Pseudoduganella dura]
MNRYLAGTAAAAAVVLAALAGWALFGPETAPPAAPDDTAQPAAEAVAQYGRNLGRDVKGMRYVGMEEVLARPRQGYRVTFATADPQPATVRDDAANAARQADWQRRFCSAQLKEQMAARGVHVVTGRVVDGGGRTQYVADCVAGQPPAPAGPGGPLL